MKKRTLISATTAVVLALSGALVMAPAASAEDAVAEETVEVVETTTEAAPAVEEAPPAPAEPAPEPAAPAEAPAAPEPAPEPVSEPVPAPAPAPAAPEAKKVTLSTPQTQPDMICTESGAGWGPKVDTTGDPATVTVTADAGFLIDSYCVKAGTTKHIVPVSPASATVVIDHPEKNSVSHYQVHQVAIPDEEEPTFPTNGCVTGISTHSTQDNDLWQNVDTRADGRIEYVEGGLHIWTLSNTSAAKVSEGIAVNYPLHDVGVLDLDWEGTSPAPGLNLFITSEHGNATLVYEEVYGQDLWLTNGSAQWYKDNAPVNGGGNGSQWHGTIDQWLTKVPNAQVVGLAYSLGSGVLGDGIIRSITAGCGTHTFDFVAPPTFEPSCTTVTGAQTIVGDGVLTVAGDWATDVIEVPFTGTLADIGTVLDIQADPLQYVGLHIDTAEGTIVFEEEPSYGGNLWSTTAWDGVEAGLGYAAFGSIEEFITLNGDVEVLGIRLLYTHPEVSTTTVTSFTIGCTVYTFEPEVVTPEPTIVTPESPTFVDTCVAGDAHWEWTDTDAYYYEEQTLVDGAIAVTAIAREGYAFPEGAETVWIAMEETAPCPIDEPEVPGEEPTDGEPSGDPADTADFGNRSQPLAVTGGGDVNPLLPIGGGLIALLGGASLLAARIMRSRAAQD